MEDNKQNKWKCDNTLGTFWPQNHREMQFDRDTIVKVNLYLTWMWDKEDGFRYSRCVGQQHNIVTSSRPAHRLGWTFVQVTRTFVLSLMNWSASYLDGINYLRFEPFVFMPCRNSGRRHFTFSTDFEVNHLKSFVRALKFDNSRMLTRNRRNHLTLLELSHVRALVL
jgi:hypothetical protein